MTPIAVEVADKDGIAGEGNGARNRKYRLGTLRVLADLPQLKRTIRAMERQAVQRAFLNKAKVSIKQRPRVAIFNYLFGLSVHERWGKRQLIFRDRPNLKFQTEVPFCDKIQDACEHLRFDLVSAGMTLQRELADFGTAVGRAGRSTVPGQRVAIHRSSRWWTTAWRASRSWHRTRGRQ